MNFFFAPSDRRAIAAPRSVLGANTGFGRSATMTTWMVVKASTNQQQSLQAQCWRWCAHEADARRKLKNIPFLRFARTDRGARGVQRKTQSCKMQFYMNARAPCEDRRAQTSGAGFSYPLLESAFDRSARKPARSSPRRGNLVLFIYIAVAAIGPTDRAWK